MREVDVDIVWWGMKQEGLQVVVVAGNTGAMLSVWDPINGVFDSLICVFLPFVVGRCVCI